MEQSSLFNIKITEEYRPLFQDISRMLTIQVITNYLLYITNPDQVTFLSYNFIKTLLYLILGIVTYWLITSKIINFSSSSKDSEKTGFFYGSQN